MSNVLDWLETQSPVNLESDIPKLPVRFAEESKLTDEEIKLLNEIIKMFQRYHDPKMNLLYLQGLYNLLSNPDAKTTILPSERGTNKSLFLFDEKISIKQIVKFIMDIIRNRNLKTPAHNLPKYRTIIKKKILNKEDNTRFSIDGKELNNIRMNFAKREKTKYLFREKNQLSVDKGRIIKYSNKRINKTNIQFLQTVFNAIQNGHYSLKDKKFNIRKNDFLFPKYEENVIYNVMLVLDTSKSISWVIPHIEKFISYITSNVSNLRDKLGLIAFNNDLAQIYHYPTLNVKQVIGTINEIEAKGQTPLGGGLNLALRVFFREQYKLPGMKNLIIMISDCFPEPLEGGHKDLLDEPSYKLVLTAIDKIKKEKIGLIIINPVVEKKEIKGWNDKLINKIKEISEVKYIEIQPKKKTHFFYADKAVIEEDNMNEFFNILSDVKINLQE